MYHQDIKKKQEQLTDPALDIVLPQKDARTTDKANVSNENKISNNEDIQAQKQQTETIYGKVYKEFSQWLDDTSKITSVDIKKFLEPVINTVTKYAYTLELDKIGRDMTLYAEVTAKNVVQLAFDAKKEIKEFLYEEASVEDKNTTRGLLKSALVYISDLSKEYLPRVTAVILPVFDYLGIKTIGEENYAWVKSKIYNTMLAFYTAAANLINQIFKSVDEQQKSEEKRHEPQISNKHSDLVVADANRALNNLDRISKFAEDCFGSEKKDFLSHRITDLENNKDGIANNRPDMMRTNLNEDISRKIFDPFPSYDDRVKDQKEIEDKNRLESLVDSRFARVGIDGELSAADKLEVRLKAKIVA